ncbi:MAG: hypothetical protein ABR606_03180 [Vicinamibacterales bacterium]
MATGLPIADAWNEQAFDERWAHWIATGAKENRVMSRRVMTFALVIGGGLATWLVIVLTFA